MEKDLDKKIDNQQDLGRSRSEIETGKRNGRRKRGVSPGVADYIAGEVKDFKSDLVPYLPADLIGGSVPYVPGMEDEAVWNAASQACGTENVYFVYSVEGGRCWYLACPASAFASNPDSWCPLASVLPGGSEYWDKETVYIYEQDGMASALKWEAGTGRMQVFLGASRTILPRIQSMDANFVTVNAEVAKVVPWRHRQLKTEKLSRAAARSMLLVGIIINLVIFSFLIFQYLLTASTGHDLEKAKEDTVAASQGLIVEAYSALQSDTVRHLARIQELLDELEAIDGTLVRYEVEGKSLEWEVLVPFAYGQGIGTIVGRAKKGVEKDGRVRVVGNR